MKPTGLGTLIVSDPARNGELHKATFTCQHCGCVSEMKRGEERPICRRCMGFICNEPACRHMVRDPKHQPIRGRLY